MHNKPHTEETKKKIGLAKKGRKCKPCSEETKRKISLANTGKVRTEETKRKLSEIQKGKTYEEKYGIEKANIIKKKQKESNTGKKRTEEFRKNTSERMKGNIISQEIKNKISKTLKGKTLEEKLGKERADEYRKNMSRIKKGHLTSPETRKKISKALKGKKQSEEHRRKNSEGHKGLSHPLSEKHKQAISKGRIKFIKENGLSFPWKDTKPELEAELILQKYNIDYEKQFYLDYNNGYRYYDFILPDYNILLEIDGIYWHSKGIKDKDIKNKRLKQQRQNDHIKDKLAKDNGFTLIRIWEDEIFKLEEYCKGIIYNTITQ